MGIIRAEVIARARGYVREGVSAGRWIRDMRELGLTYRRTDMLADYRNVLHIETKKDALKYVRKDRYPTEKVMASVTWALSKEFMYVVKVRSVLKLGEPVTERNINILSDVPMTPTMVEAEVEERWGEWEKYAAELIVGLQAWTAVRRVME